MRSQRILPGLVICTVGALAAAGETPGSLRWRTGGAPLGLHSAIADLRAQCGTLALGCTSTATLPLYTSPVAQRSVSMQMGFGDAQGPLKTSRAPAVSVSLLGRAGIAQDVGVYGRIGTTVDRPPALASATGGERGVSYGIGVSWDFSRRGSAVLGFDSYDVRGPAGEPRDVRATSVGLQWRY